MEKYLNLAVLQTVILKSYCWCRAGGEDWAVSARSAGASKEI